MKVVSPQTFVIREECEKAAFQHGFRRSIGEKNGWACYRSTTAQGNIWLAAEGSSGPWYLALDHAGVAEELNIPTVSINGPGVACYAFRSLSSLYEALPRLYELAVSLPDAPLTMFEAETAGLPRNTEAERLVVQRIGQNVFRSGLLEYWRGRCPLTGISEPALLRASHITPWADCESDAERLDVRNGLLLSALWDAAFDRALVSFADDGIPLISPKLGHEARAALMWSEPLALTPQHLIRIKLHRERFYILAEMKS
ncbi:HNH endonuclease [Rhodobacter sp. 24-YEA-8]|uniref:HNH endonuclease n=1 Tax=Rhodobacter sp. 24-YEA-8 TaxID=1884310 RepID=UPI000896D1ED|nr:HNH endonuclease [Rhodobacter sp. 24-YEA-8]SEC26918.1 HNH endonuclease [Rhodobacter sp. 24-YEA-8]